MDREYLGRSEPDEVLGLLKKGNDRFVAGQSLDQDHSLRIEWTAADQNPFVCILSCIDSRVIPELIFDLGIGDSLTIRIAGDVINPDIVGSMEFACEVKEVRLIVILGHTDCGAIKGSCDSLELGSLTSLLRKLRPAVEEVGCSSGDEALVEEAAICQVFRAIDRIREQSQIIRSKEAQGEIKIVPALYDVKSGQASFLDWRSL